MYASIWWNGPDLPQMTTHSPSNHYSDDCYRNGHDRLIDWSNFPTRENRPPLEWLTQAKRHSQPSSRRRVVAQITANSLNC